MAKNTDKSIERDYEEMLADLTYEVAGVKCRLMCAAELLQHTAESDKMRGNIYGQRIMLGVADGLRDAESRLNLEY